MQLTIERPRPANLSADQIRRTLNDCNPELVEKFISFHRNNKDIFDLFVSNSWGMAMSGRKRYSAWTIANKIRWDKDIQTIGDEFKINNNYIALYARLVMARVPALKGFFNLRAPKKG